MRSRQHRTPGPHASVRATLVHWLCMHRLHGFVSWASAPRARWSFGAAHRCWRTGHILGVLAWADLCRLSASALRDGSVPPSSLPRRKHRQSRVNSEPTSSAGSAACAAAVSPHLCAVPAQCTKLVCCACVLHGDNHQWAGIPWVRRVVHHPLCVVWAMCLACHHTLMHFRPASACVCHTVTPTTFHSGRV